MIVKTIQKVTDKVKANNERGARTAVLEDLFYDFNRNRHQVYLMNFIRGIFFGVGSVIGGTVVIALIVWILASLSGVFPALHGVFQPVTSSLQHQKN
jgi:hypothetical protein